MRARTCKKCFTNCGYYPEWINGSPYCPECGDKKKKEIQEKRELEK